MEQKLPHILLEENGNHCQPGEGDGARIRHSGLNPNLWPSPGGHTQASQSCASNFALLSPNWGWIWPAFSSLGYDWTISYTWRQKQLLLFSWFVLCNVFLHGQTNEGIGYLLLQQNWGRVVGTGEPYEGEEREGEPYDPASVLSSFFSFLPMLPHYFPLEPSLVERYWNSTGNVPPKRKLLNCWNSRIRKSLLFLQTECQFIALW